MELASFVSFAMHKCPTQANISLTSGNRSTVTYNQRTANITLVINSATQYCKHNSNLLLRSKVTQVHRGQQMETLLTGEILYVWWGTHPEMYVQCDVDAMNIQILMEVKGHVRSEQGKCQDVRPCYHDNAVPYCTVGLTFEFVCTKFRLRLFWLRKRVLMSTVVKSWEFFHILVRAS